MNKSFIGIIGASALTLIGIVLCLNARAFAWASASSWSGPAMETPYGHQQIAIGQAGLVLMAGGILLLLATYIHWLFIKGPGK